MTENKNTLKYVSLITLTLQNAVLGLSMRYGRTRHSKDELFFSSTGKIGNSLLFNFQIFHQSDFALFLFSRCYGRMDEIDHMFGASFL